MQANRQKQPYSFQVIQEFDRASLNIDFACNLKVAIIRKKEKYETRNVPLDLATHTAIFNKDQLRFDSVFSQDTNTLQYDQHAPLKINLCILDPSRKNKTAGFYMQDIVSILNEGNLFVETKRVVNLQKCPDPDSKLYFTIKVNKLREATEDELQKDLYLNDFDNRSRMTEYTNNSFAQSNHSKNGFYNTMKDPLNYNKTNDIFANTDQQFYQSNNQKVNSLRHMQFQDDNTSQKTGRSNTPTNVEVKNLRDNLFKVDQNDSARSKSPLMERVKKNPNQSQSRRTNDRSRPHSKNGANSPSISYTSNNKSRSRGNVRMNYDMTVNNQEALNLKPLIPPKKNNNDHINVLPGNVLNQQYDFKPATENPLHVVPDFCNPQIPVKLQDNSNVQNSVRLSAKNYPTSPLCKIPDFASHNISPRGQSTTMATPNNDYGKRLSTPINDNTYNKVTTPHTDYIQRQNSTENISQNYYSTSNNNHSMSSKLIQRTDSILTINQDITKKSSAIPIFQKYNPGNTGPLRIALDPTEANQGSTVTYNYRNQVSNVSNVRDSERINDDRLKALRQNLVKKEIERNQFEEQVDKEIAKIAIAKLPNQNVLDELNFGTNGSDEWVTNGLEHVNSFEVEKNLQGKPDKNSQIFPETKRKDIMFDSLANNNSENFGKNSSFKNTDTQKNNECNLEAIPLYREDLPPIQYREDLEHEEDKNTLNLLQSFSNNQNMKTNIKPNENPQPINTTPHTNEPKSNFSHDTHNFDCNNMVIKPSSLQEARESKKRSRSKERRLSNVIINHSPSEKCPFEFEKALESEEKIYSNMNSKQTKNQVSVEDLGKPNPLREARESKKRSRSKDRRGSNVIINHSPSEKCPFEFDKAQGSEEKVFSGRNNKQEKNQQSELEFNLSESNASRSYFTNNSNMPNFHKTHNSPQTIKNPPNTEAIEAKIHKELKIKYQDQIQNLEYEVKDLNNENKDLKVNIDFYKGQTQKFKLQLSDIDLDEVEQIRGDLKRYKLKNLDLQKEYKNMERDKLRLQEELIDKKKLNDQEKNENIYSIKDQRNKENALREKLDREISSYKEKLSCIEKENETLKQQLKYNFSSNNNKSNLNDLEYKNESLMKDNKRLLQETSDLAEEAKEYKLKVFDLKDEKEDLLVQLDDMKNKHADKTETWKKILNKKDEEVANLKQQNSDIVLEFEEIKHENGQTTLNTQWYEKDKNLLKDKVAELKSELGDKDYELKELSLEVRTLKKRIKSFENNKLIEERSSTNRKCNNCINNEVTVERNKQLEDKLEEMEADFYNQQKELLDKKDHLYSNLADSDLYSSGTKIQLENQTLRERIFLMKKDMKIMDSAKRESMTKKQDIERRLTIALDKQKKDEERISIMTKESLKLESENVRHEIEIDKLQKDLKRYKPKTPMSDQIYDHGLKDKYVKAKENIGECVNHLHFKADKISESQIDQLTSILMKER